MRVVLTNVDDDDLEWLTNRIFNSFGEEHSVVFGTINDRLLQANTDQPAKKTLGACRFFMTRKLSDEPHQLLLIGMNPSYARDFIGTGRGPRPASDPTARAVYNWNKDGVYDRLPTLGRITLINLAPAINPQSQRIKETLETLDCDDYFKKVLTTTLQTSIAEFPGTTHIIRTWGEESRKPNRWKPRLHRYISEQHDGDIGLATHPSVWDFRLPEGMEQPSYPPHVGRFRRNGWTPNGLTPYQAG